MDAKENKSHHNHKHFDLRIYAVVFIGGVFGVLVRTGISAFSRIIHTSEGHSLIFGHITLGTFISNMLACFIFAAVSSLVVAIASSRRKELCKYALGTGFCGGLSTMSTFAFEGMASLIFPCGIFALLLMILSIVLGVFSALAGSLLGSSIAEKISLKRKENIDENNITSEAVK